MKREDPAICVDRGQSIEPDGARGREGCREPGGEAASARPSDRDRDAIVRRLGESYREARALVSAEDSDPAHRGQLDWIFGVRGDDAPDAAALDARTSELVVLWLEDLIRHMEEVGPAAGEPDAVAARSHRAARVLDAATRDFAETVRRAAGAGPRP